METVKQEVTAKKAARFYQVFHLCIGLLSFVIIAAPKLSSPLILLLALVVLYGYAVKAISWKSSLPGNLLMAFYLAYLVGSIFTIDGHAAIKTMEHKLALLLFPLLLSFKPGLPIKLSYPVTGLIVGSILAGIIGFWNSIACFQFHDNQISWLRYCFTSSLISPIHHPTYFACFLIFGMVGAWKGYRESWKGYQLWWIIVYLFFCLVFFGLCFSVSAILFLLLLTLLGSAYYFFQRYGKKKMVILSTGVLLTGCTLIFAIPGIRDDVSGIRKELFTYLQSPGDYLSKYNNRYVEGNQERLILWTVTGQLCLEHPLGVGTGNVDLHLDKRLNEYGFSIMVEKDLNPHNQYLQTFLEVGVVGLFILLAFLFTSLRAGIRAHSWLLVIAVSGLMFNSLFESMLQRQSGVIFFGFWICFLLLHLRSASINKKESGIG